MRSSVSILFATEPQAALAKKIASLTPGGPLTESLFTMGGTEANETAIQPARCFTGNTEIVSLRHSYHGPTATGDDAYRGTRRARPATGRHRARRIMRMLSLPGLTYPSCEVKCSAGSLKSSSVAPPAGSVAGFIA
jgi:4-aminobutyrate aminotransferase-like enzyme